MEKTAIIAGGGIGGLSTATALAHRGWQVTVFERQREIRASGSGIYIWENGLRILKALGAEAIADGAFRGMAFEQRNSEDSLLETGELPTTTRLITIPRGRLLEGLNTAALKAGVTIVTGAEISSVASSGTVHLANGQSLSADLVIGADGVWSIARRSLGLELISEQTSEGGLRAIIPGTQDDLGPNGRGKYIEVWNERRRLLITPISPTEIYLAFACQRDDREATPAPLAKSVWIDSFPRWGHLIQRVDELIPWAPYSIVKVSSWSSGRAALIGDAAYAQPPNLGQGAGMAMQSALALATHLEGTIDRRDIPDVLARWETAERPLVDHCQKWSTLYCEISTMPEAVRNRILTQILTDPWIRAQIARASGSTPTGT